MNKLLAILIIFCLSGCKTTKSIDSTSETKEEKITYDSTGYYKKKLDSTKVLLEENRKEKKTGITFNKPEPTKEGCPTCPTNTIEVTKTGTIKATGNISAFNQDVVEANKRIEFLNTQLEEQINATIKKDEELREERKQRSLVKKTKVFNQWWLILIVLITGIIIGVRFRDNIKGVISKAKHVSSKIFS